VPKDAMDSLNLPAVIAHRGAPRLAPENTLAGLIEAKAAGARWTEFDVTLCQDNRAVVIHDDTLERTTNGHGNVLTTPYATLKTLSAGAWFAPQFSDEKIPSLDEYINTAANLNLGINIELKPIPLTRSLTLCQLVLDALKNWPSHLATPLLSSFDEMNLRHLNHLNCSFPLALNVVEINNEALELAHALDCYSIHAKASQLTVEHIFKAHQKNLHVLAYTVNNRSEAQVLLDQGVKAVFSDIPDLLFAS